MTAEKRPHRRLTPKEVHAIRELHDSGMGNGRIAAHLDIERSIVRRVANRESYTKVPEATCGPEGCQPHRRRCRRCLERIASINITQARRTFVSVRCVHCGSPRTVTVSTVLYGRGMVRCPKRCGSDPPGGALKEIGAARVPQMAE